MALQDFIDTDYTTRMAIFEFMNENEATLSLTIQPWGDKFEVPHLARVGIRYSLDEGVEDRCLFAVEGGSVEFWCNAAIFEIDIIHPSALDRLSRDICVTGGWCGGLVDGIPTTVYDLLPQTGEVDARQFAELVVRAEGDPLEGETLPWLEAKFVEHFGAHSVSAESLLRLTPRPFGDATS